VTSLPTFETPAFPPIRESTRRIDRPRRRIRSLRFLIPVALLGLIALVTLPFAALLRVATFLYLDRGWPTWVAVGGGMGAAGAVVTLYSAWAWKKLTGRVRIRLLAQRVALPLVLLYCLYGLVYLSAEHVKDIEERAYYGSLHPLLRLSLSTVTLVDRDIVVTDIGRTPDDYRAAGLEPQEASMHYPQGDGYVHAVDLRTAGRGAVRNWLAKAYFSALGFHTLRHVGTADHLHVSLPTGTRRD